MSALRGFTAANDRCAVRVVMTAPAGLAPAQPAMQASPVHITPTWATIKPPTEKGR